MVSAVLLLLLAASVPAGANIHAQYFAVLSNFQGEVPYYWVHMSVDRQSNEVFVFDPKKRDIRIFNRLGMEVHRFTPEHEIGVVTDISVDDEGRLYVLPRSSGNVLYAYDRRARLESEIALTGLPEGFSGFKARRIVCRGGLVYLVDDFSLKIVVTDKAGAFQKGYDLPEVMGLDEKTRDEASMFGFNVDGDGNMLFTMATLFSAFRLSPEGRLEAFGEGGGAPGKFSIASGIAADDRGNIYVSDRLRSKVLVFGKDLAFITEFGDNMTKGKDRLIAPSDLAVDGRDKLYVSRAGGKGVLVYSLIQR